MAVIRNRAAASALLALAGMADSGPIFGERDPAPKGRALPVPRRVGPRVGRNDPCPCGCRQKRKRCPNQRST